MKWACFFHIYQPAEQYFDIVEAVVKQSYRPLIQSLKGSEARITLNINGALTELLHSYGFEDVIKDLSALAEAGNLEFTGSAMYHAFLPLLSEREIRRQIEINDETNRKFFGSAYQPKGFFPPEMGYSRKLVPILEELGYKWLILDEIACGGLVESVDYSQSYKIKDSSLNVFFRQRRISNLIMGAIARSRGTLKESLREELSSSRYILTAMDGETFGHHRPGLDSLLAEIFTDPDLHFVCLSELPELYPSVVEVEPVNSTWASSKADIDSGNQFLSWYDNQNEIHKLQWEFTELVLNEVYKLGETDALFSEVRKKMDIALASDHFWWASAKPWWSLEMIGDGAQRLLTTLKTIPSVDPEILEHGRSLYEKIISLALTWQRSGKIRQMAKENLEHLRIPFKERTLETPGKENVYHAFIDMMKDLEKKASQRGEYEKAILWRDAVFKIENKSDIYDTVNAIDLVRVELPNEEVEKIIKSYEGKYKAMRGGQPEQRE